MAAADFRRIALGLAGTTEGAHMDHPDFRAHGRIFATIHPDRQRGSVKLTPEQQQAFIDANPGAFEPASGAWGRQGWTFVRFAAADEETVGEALTSAWQNIRTAAVRRKPSKPVARKSGRLRRKPR
jgi:hypothetical protein